MCSMVSWKKHLRLQPFLLYLSQTCNVTGFCHCFRSPGTALDKVRASRSVLPWLPGSQLCVAGHIKAFIEDGQKRGMLAWGQKYAQKGLK